MSGPSPENGSGGGGLFRTDGGVKVSSGLDVSDAGIAQEWGKVRNDSDETTWMLLEYEGKSKLKVCASGKGGATELLAMLTEDKIFFGGFRTTEGKFLHLMSVGEDAGGMARGRAAAHKNAALNALEGASGEVCGNSKEDFAAKLASVSF
eukprot:CAMPEP_0117475032 /NCGR_PEP_ID=MMETSP0784-20121206/9587_1 /TAXON_ID=39447 /ORGANISM="" /LENGTH=149 /DNA_ID=CAMNT_0005269269 /DNA_START=39 /DNA_END=488 /DNA_ORIENTATION=+